MLRKLPNADEMMQLNFQKVYEELENQEYEEDEDPELGKEEEVEPNEDNNIIQP